MPFYQKLKEQDKKEKKMKENAKFFKNGRRKEETRAWIKQPLFSLGSCTLTTAPQ